MHSGKNHIVRKSSEASTTVPDVPCYNTLLKEAEAGNVVDQKYNRHCGIPNRMLLPKGTETGMEFILVVALTDDHADTKLEKEGHGPHAQCGIHGETYPDSRPLGYPFDRVIPETGIVNDFTNLHKSIVTVTHNDHH